MVPQPDEARGKSLTSPYGLVQERVARDALYPWRVVVLCALLNQTTGRQVRPVVGELFGRWPTPRAMARAGPGLEALVRPLGLWRRRGALLRRLSRECAAGVPPAECHGVGRYARDALAIFAEGRTDVRPLDGHLKRYLAWRKRWFTAGPGAGYNS